MHAIETIKEGRALDGESLVVVQAVLDKISDSFDNLEEGKSMLEVVLGLKTLEPMLDVEVPEVELQPVDPIGLPQIAGRKISLRLAQAIINNTK